MKVCPTGGPQPFAIPDSPRPAVVETATHEGGEARALILLRPDGRFEVKVHLFAKPGYCIPLASPSLSLNLEDKEWGRAFNNQIWADDLDSARAAAAHYMAVALTEYADACGNPADQQEPSGKPDCSD